jgi:uncharacterized protein YodC (DUF2158 family)
MSPHLTPGDIVMLKSGSPTMRVEHIARLDDGREIVLCQWFMSGEPKSASFPLENLAPRGT